MCAGCGAPGTGPKAVRLDLDVKATPPEYVCMKCKRKPTCKQCCRRRGRVTVDGVCCSCERANQRREKARWLRACTGCAARVDITETNDHGECASCAYARLVREHPITVRRAP
jgi:DNA-directed RNA polymerase subunit RPC12/RpoP